MKTFCEACGNVMQPDPFGDDFICENCDEKARLRKLSVEERIERIEQIVTALSHDTRRLLDAIPRIDSDAMRTMERITEYENAAEERYKAHSVGQKHWSDHTSAIQHLQAEIVELRREIECLKRPGLPEDNSSKT